MISSNLLLIEGHLAGQMFSKFSNYQVTAYIVLCNSKRS